MQNDVEQLKRQLLPIPALPIDDATPEAIISQMHSHDGKAILLSDEGDVLNIMTGNMYQRVNQKTLLSPILNGYGNGPVCSIRKNGEYQVPVGSLSICLAAQPDLVYAFAGDATTSGRGLQSRFLFFSPEPMAGRRTWKSQPVPDELRDWW